MTLERLTSIASAGCGNALAAQRFALIKNAGYKTYDRHE